MNLPKITITGTQDSPRTIIKDSSYSHLPCPQDENKLKTTPSIHTPECNKQQQRQQGQGEGEPEDFDPSIGAKPYSPFYRHETNPITSSTERLTLEIKRLDNHQKQNQDGSLPDIERGQQQIQSTRRRNNIKSIFSFWPFGSGHKKRSRHSKLWAGEKQDRSCLSGLTGKQRFAAKVAIAVLTLGSMIAVALGITVAVGGGVWTGRHRQGTIGR